MDLKTGSVELWRNQSKILIKLVQLVLINFYLKSFLKTLLKKFLTQCRVLEIKIVFMIANVSYEYLEVNGSKIT